eukprot:7042633-Alexandrium_andersonii.AAC.1
MRGPSSARATGGAGERPRRALGQRLQDELRLPRVGGGFVGAHAQYPPGGRRPMHGGSMCTAVVDRVRLPNSAPMQR